MHIGYWLSRARRCNALYPGHAGFRCARRKHHQPPHRAPFGSEW